MATIGPVPWTLKAMIAGIDIAMLMTQIGNERLHARPLMTQAMDEDEILWFFDQRDSPTSVDIPGNPYVHLAYCDPHQGYISVNGRADLVVDPMRMRSRWSPAHYQLFPQGLNDSALALVRISVEQAVSWQAPLRRHGRRLPGTAAMIRREQIVLGWEESLPS